MTDRDSVWKPLRGPANDWPLLVCDAASMSGKSNFEPADLLYPNLLTENAPVYHNDTYKWYFLGSHRSSEMIIFKQADTLSTACLGKERTMVCKESLVLIIIGVPQCSIANPLASPDELPRESIEARALVYYAT